MDTDRRVRVRCLLQALMIALVSAASRLWAGVPCYPWSLQIRRRGAQRQVALEGCCLPQAYLKFNEGM